MLVKRLEIKQLHLFNHINFYMCMHIKLKIAKRKWWIKNLHFHQVST